MKLKNMNGKNRRLNHLHLFPTPTFWTGIGGLIDICGALNRYDTTSSQARYDDAAAAKADYEAMRSDWEAVGESMWQAVNHHQSARKKANR